MTIDLKSKIIAQEGITFDDCLILPGYSTFSKEEADLTTELHSKIILKLPIISSPMDRVTEDKMAIAIASEGGLGFIHRNLTIEKQAEFIKNVKTFQFEDKPNASVDKKGSLLVGGTVGPGSDIKERTEKLIDAGADIILIDSAQGHSSLIIDAIKYVKSNFPNIPIMAGNVATYDGAKLLVEAGVDIIRVGIGPGSICSTRIVTGIGVPQITAIMEAFRATEGTSVKIIADGGIKQTGDMAKALAVGAHAVMLGSLLARFDESPGEIIEKDGKKYKEYRGMGSIGAVMKGSERYGQKNVVDPKKVISEGVEGLVEYSGSVADYLYQVKGSLRSSFFYVGGKTINEYQEKSKLIRITNASLTESHAHSIKITNPGDNYNVK